MFCDFRDVKQSISTAEYLDKRAEIDDTNDFSEVGLPDFRLRGQVLDDLDRCLRRRTIRGRDVDCAVILDVNLPDMDGFDVCAQIRSSSEVPIVMLTVRNPLDEIMNGSEFGG